MPFNVSWPGHIPPGKTDEQTILSANDLFSTFCKLAGAKLPTDFTFSGKDKSKVLPGKTMIHLSIRVDASEVQTWPFMKITGNY